MKKKCRFVRVGISAVTVVSIIVAAFLAATVCIALFSSFLSESLLSSAKSAAESATAQTAIAINNYLDLAEEKLQSLEKAAVAAKDTAEFSESLRAMNEMQSDICAIAMYSKDGKILSYTGSGTRKKSVYADLSFNRELFSNSNSYAISAPHVETLNAGEYPWVITVAMKTESKLFKEAAYLAVDFRFSEIARYVDKINIGRRGYCYITDSKGNIIYHPQQQLLFSKLKSEPDTSALSSGVHETRDALRAIQPVGGRRWRVIGVSFTDELRAERMRRILIGVAFSAVGTAAISALILLWLNKAVTKPVKKLIHDIEKFENDTDFECYELSTPVTEIGDISVSVSHMTERIRELLTKIHREEKALRKTELRALQAQINPHFLYNTLDSIQWMCEADNCADASKMVVALARLFRISISRGHELITVRDELQHAKCYLIIQSYRYRDRFTYRFEIEEGLEQYLCNKITAQPLIENAIYHGIDRTEREGLITVTVKTCPDDDGDILLSVADNGVGMTKEQCEQILKKERSDSGGIGVKNVNDRLKIYFGEKYGLFIDSTPDVGTTVTARWPKITKEEQYEI